MERFESSFPPDYRKNDIAKIISLITHGKFCQLICLPGGGKATLLKLFANNQGVRSYHLGKDANKTYFLYTNLLELPDFTEISLYKFFLRTLTKIQGENLDGDSLSLDTVVLFQRVKDTLDSITNTENITLVVLLDHFDEYQNNLPHKFFQLLRSLKSVGKYHFSVVFGTRRDLKDLVDPDVYKEFYDFFVDNTVFISLYDKSATDFLFSQIETLFGKTLSPKNRQRLIDLTGGHTKLLKVCTESTLEGGENIDEQTLLGKSIVKGALLEIWNVLTPQEQQYCIDSTQGEKVAETPVPETLRDWGLVENGNRLTIPLLSLFISTFSETQQKEIITYDATKKEIRKGQRDISDLLSSQEYTLLRFLIAHANQIIERGEIIKVVWPESKNSMGITDQAIDQLIFRLRHKIEDDPNSPTHIQTIKGRGFRFSP